MRIEPYAIETEAVTFFRVQKTGFQEVFFRPVRASNLEVPIRTDKDNVLSVGDHCRSAGYTAIATDKQTAKTRLAFFFGLVPVAQFTTAEITEDDKAIGPLDELRESLLLVADKSICCATRLTERIPFGRTAVEELSKGPMLSTITYETARHLVGGPIQ